MRRILWVALVAAWVLGARQMAPLAMESLPVAWTYRLTPACAWQPRSWARVAGIEATPGRTPAAVAARQACWAGRGLKSPTPLVKTILRRWPTKAEFTAWEVEDANGGALLTRAAPRGVQAGAGG